MRRFRALPALVIACLALFFVGCAKAPTAAPERDTSAKSFAAVSGKAVVYVYRNEMIGAAVKMPVLVDGHAIADTVSKSFLRLELAPGSHDLVSKAEKDCTLTLATEAGKVYYVWQEVKMGFLYARCKLQVMDEAVGQAGVRECALLQAPSELPAQVTAPAAPAPAGP